MTWFGSCSQCSGLYSPACASASGHKKGGLVVFGRDGDALGLISMAASCCFLCSGRVFVESFCKVFLKGDNIFAAEGEK